MNTIWTGMLAAAGVVVGAMLAMIGQIIVSRRNNASTDRKIAQDGNDALRDDQMALINTLRDDAKDFRQRLTEAEKQDRENSVLAMDNRKKITSLEIEIMELIAADSRKTLSYEGRILELQHDYEILMGEHDKLKLEHHSLRKEHDELRKLYLQGKLEPYTEEIR